MERHRRRGGRLEDPSGGPDMRTAPGCSGSPVEVGIGQLLEPALIVLVFEALHDFMLPVALGAPALLPHCYDMQWVQRSMLAVHARPKGKFELAPCQRVFSWRGRQILGLPAACTPIAVLLTPSASFEVADMALQAACASAERALPPRPRSAGLLAAPVRTCRERALTAFVAPPEVTAWQGLSRLPPPLAPALAAGR